MNRFSPAATPANAGGCMSKIKKALEKAKVQRSKEGGGPWQAAPESKHLQPTLPTSPERSAPEVARVLTMSTTKDVHKPTPLNGKKQTLSGIRYAFTRTKVLPVDPMVFRKNKVLALFSDSEITDPINILRTQVLNKLDELGGRSLLVCSANRQEGKTFTAINLAISITKQLDRTVLLVDTDLKTPTSNHYDFATDFFGLDVKAGLSDYLIGDAELEDLLINPGIEKLTILPGGKSLPNSSELLGSPRMAEMILEVKNRYQKDRIIVFDGTAVLESPDSLAYSKYIDGILIVVEVERTTPAQLKRAMEFLKGSPVIGTVMNKLREKSSEHV
jgi:non-specific protein-tyrosine kinase